MAPERLQEYVCSKRAHSIFQVHQDGNFKKIREGMKKVVTDKDYTNAVLKRLKA